jgi:hypothetical protein
VYPLEQPQAAQIGAFAAVAAVGIRAFSAQTFC